MLGGQTIEFLTSSHRVTRFLEEDQCDGVSEGAEPVYWTKLRVQFAELDFVLETAKLMFVILTIVASR